MRLAPRLLLLALGPVALGTLPASGQPGPSASAHAANTYTLTYARAGDEHVAIALKLAAPLPVAQWLVMPRAIPMGYGEVYYDEFVDGVVAITSSGAEAPAKREEGPRWQLPAGTVTVRYRVNLHRMEREVLAAADASRIRDGYLGALGYSVFAFVDGDERRPVRLRLEGPAGWPVFSTLAPRLPLAGVGVEAAAPHFYALADSQIVMGPKASIHRIGDTPVPLFLATYAEGHVDLDRVSRLVRTAFTRVVDYFGSAPFPHYTVQQELLAPVSPRHRYGFSMEHLESSTYYLDASTGLTADASADAEARALFNFAHHIAHAWAPKRVYGQGYFPFQWELAPVLDSIWFAEGFGQYAAIMAIAAGEHDPAAYREALLTRRFRTTLDSAPAFLKRLTLVELSRVASTRYAEDFRTGRLVFSRGGLMAAAIDDRIRAATGGAKSLRDAFRFLVAWSAREQRAFTDAELPRLIEHATGVDVGAVVDEWMRPLK
jgi:predicted metalloprotease with PDZ domain